MAPIVFPPPAWTNQDIVLFHGTSDTYAAAIVSGPILSSRGRPFRDFGPGFYTTTIDVQAHTWAAEIASSITGAKPAVIEITVSREDLASLDALAFVRGDFHAVDFWSLVHHCRAGQLTTAARHPVRPDTTTRLASTPRQPIWC